MRKPRTEIERKQVLGGIVEQEMARAEGGQSDELQQLRELALEYYQGHLPAAPSDADGNVLEGRSDVVSRDVADTTTATLAMLREMLILDGELSIEAESDDDEPLAKAEADICTDVVFKDNPGEMIFLTAIKDAVLLKNGCVKVRFEDGEVVIDAVPIENISYTSGYAGKLQQIPFFSERLLYTRSDLVSMGISKDVVDGLPAHDDLSTGTEKVRNTGHTSSRDGQTRDQDDIECREAYVLTDLNGDGVSERYRCLIAGANTCLEYEEVPVIPYALGSPFINPHRLTGESLFDHVWSIQNSNTTMWRQWHDNIAVVNNGRYIYDPGQVTEADIMNPVAGGGIRARNPVNSVVPLVIPDMTQGIASAVAFNNRKRTEAVGAALDMASAEAQLANKAATVAAIEKGNQELISAMIASNLAMTLFLGTYKLVHFFLRTFAERPYIARIQGQAIPVDPRMWQRRRRMEVKCGMSPSQKAMVQQALVGHVQVQAMAMQSGLNGILANPDTLYRTQLRYLKSMGIRDAESLIVDPQSPSAQQAAQSQAQQQQQMAAMQAQMQQLIIQLEQAKLAEEARQHDEEIRFKYYDADLDAEVQEAKLAGQGVIDLERQRMSNEAAERATQRATEKSDTDTGGPTG